MDGAGGPGGQRPLQPASASDLSLRRPSSPETPQGKRLSTACLECKKKKRKCSATAPCSGCVANNVPCIFDENLDKRRKVSAKRTSDELEIHKDVVTGLLDALRSPDPFELEEIITLTRENATISDLAQHIQRRTKSQQWDLGNSAAWSKQHAASLEGLKDVIQRDHFLVYMPAKPWTNVTENSQLVSYLMSLYLTWHHPLFSLFDVKLFLEEARSEKVDSKICSPLLVNAVLAMGWQFADHRSAWSESGSKTTLGDRFYDEATRLWGLQLGQSSLASLSALAIMAQLAYIRGLDKLGVMFLSQAAVIYRECCFSRRRIPSQSSLSRRQTEQSLNTATSGYSLTHSLFFYILIKPSRLKIPQMPRTSPQLVRQEELQWISYPGIESQLSHPSLFTECAASLTKIIMDIQHDMFDEESPLTAAQYQVSTNKYRNMLDHWYSSLPDELHIGNASISHYICLHLVFHSIYIILLVKIFVEIRPDNTTNNDFLLAARQTKIYNANQLAALCSRHQRLYGRYMRPFMLPQASYISVMVLLEDLAQPLSRKAFVDMCVLLRGASASIYIAKGMLRMVKPTAARLGVQLPKEAQDLLDEFETVSWENADYHKFSSVFPNYAFKENLSSEDSFEMGDLLKQFESQAKLRVWE